VARAKLRVLGEIIAVNCGERRVPTVDVVT